MVSSDEELPNEVSYRDLDGSTRKVKVSYSWKPQRCKVCLSFGHVNGACQQPSQKTTQVYRPRQEPQNGVITTKPSTDTPGPTEMMAEKMNEHSDSLGQRHELEKDKSGLSSFPIIVSGLKLNHAKSKVYVGACIENKDHIAQTLGVAEGNLPVPYLGLPLISTGINKVSCQPILQKIKNRISSWKNRLLSKAGRLELIRSVLISYSIYWSHAFLLPAGLLNDIDKLLMNFFWNVTDGKAMHMVNWDNICKPKDEGGLNLRHIRYWNKA
ncbi:hypothetical protein OPV22_005944 [Ensete ventricosum]|uniref:Reverse transcriptase zinc-binding domain-containing protein n=1 Tax=Ensete ventricosum TaxID=4639 RepID=A0AAV8RNP4_ENSVE|nr:hypothetical protein OPV22_005944 [Ensete ventricosum]